MFDEFITGARYFFQGFTLVRRPGLRRYIIMPMLINVLVFSAALWIGIAQFDNLIDWILPAGDSWWAEFARVVMWALFAAAVLVILFFSFTVVANLIGAPFNGLLSEKVERHLMGEMFTEGGGFGEFLSTILPTLWSEFRKLSYFIILAGIVFILTLIPVINVLSPILWASFTSWMLAVEYIAYPMENNRIYFSAVKSKLRERRALSLGFGMAALGTSLIPLVNFLVMPAAVAGATALWVERLRNRGVEMKPGLPKEN